jgi:hypothetical protein
MEDLAGAVEEIVMRASGEAFEKVARDVGRRQVFEW